ncbi:unnamed protein product [Closterium sp. NIES-54]
MALLRVLPFDHEGRPVQFDTWLDDLQLYLLSNSKDSVSLFDLASGAATAPPAIADSATRSQWLTRDAAAHLAIRNHLPLAECAHFRQHRTAQALYDAVVTRYSSPATAALGRLLLPYLFPELSAFATVEDLVSHLRTSDARYRATVLAEFLERNQPPIFITLYFIVTPMLVALHVFVAEDVGAASASPKCRSRKGKGGRGGGGGSGGGGGGSGSGGGGSSGGSGGRGGGGGGGTGGGSGGSGGGGGGSGGSGGSGGGGTGGSRTGPRHGGLGGGQRQQQQQRPSETQPPQQLRDHAGRFTLSTTASPASTRLGVLSLVTTSSSLAWQIYFRSWIAIFDLDFDAILHAMYALSVSAEGDYYRCVPPDPSIAAAAIGASASGTLPGTAPAQALHTFMLDSGASRCFFRDSTTLTPLPVPVRLADPTGGPVVAHSSTVLPCPVVPSGSLSGLHLPSFSTNLVSTAALQDAMVTTTTPGGQRVSICTCTRTGRHLATFTRQPGSSLYTLATEPLEVAASAQVSASGQKAASCSCRLLSHQALLWHHRLGHPSLPRLLGMHSHLLVSGLPRSLPPLPPSPAPPCLPCVEGRQRAAPHSSSFPPTTAPLQTLHMDVSGPARVSGQGREWYFLLVVHYTRYTMVFPLRSKGKVVDVLIPWIRTVRLQLRERSTSGLVSPYRRPRPHCNVSVFRVWGSRAFVRDTSADKISTRAIPCVFLGFVPDAPGWQFYHPSSRRVLPSQDVTFDESVPFYRLFPPPVFPTPAPAALPCSRAAPVATSGGAEPRGAGSEGAGSRGAEPEGVEPGGAESEGAESGGAEPRGVALSGGPAGASPRLSPQHLREWLVRRARLRCGAPGAGGAGDAGAGGAGVTAEADGPEDPREPGAAGAGGSCAGGAGAGGAGVGGAGVGGTGVGGAGAAGAGAVDPGAGGAGGTVRPRPYFSEPLLHPASPLPAPSPYTDQSGGLTERREPASRPVSPVCTTRRAPRLRPPLVPGTHTMALRPSSIPLRVPLPAPPESSLPESAAASPLVAELLDFAAACRLDYATALVAESAGASPPSVGGECALGTDVLEDRQEDFECLAAAVPCFASMLLAPEGDPNARNIPTPRSYAEAITGPFSFQWDAAMDAEMASLKSTGTFIDAVPPHGANIVDGIWIFRVKRSPGSPPAFKARYVAQGFSQRQGVDYFQTFSPTPKMTTLRVLLHVAAQRDYELHSLDISTAFLRDSMHEEIWLRRPPRFTRSFPAGTQTTLAALGFAPATADPSLFLRTDTSLPPFYILVYVDDLVFATADTEALTLVLQRFGFHFSSPRPTPLSTSHSLSTPPSDESVEPSAAAAAPPSPPSCAYPAGARRAPALPTTGEHLPACLPARLPAGLPACRTCLPHLPAAPAMPALLRLLLLLLLLATSARVSHAPAPSDAWRTEFGDEAELPTWLELLGQGVDIYALDYDAILTAMYALPTSADRACYLCVPPDPGIAPAALGAGEAAALGASVSPALGTGEAAALGAGESALSGTVPAEALYTFTLDSGASRSFFRDSTTLTPLSRPVPVSLADPSGGPVRATSSTVLPCPAVPSGTLSGLYLPSFSTNLVAGSALQDAGVHQFTPAYERVTHCTCAQTGHHLATFTRQLGSGLYTLTTESPQVAVSASAPGFSLPSHPRLLLPVFLVLRGGSAPLLTPPRSLPQRLPCRLSTWTSFCAEHGIHQTFTLPASPQQNGVAEHHIGLVMEVARTSMIHAAAPHFLWPFAVRYAAHQLNLWPRVSLPETSPTLLWTGKVGDASRFRVWGARAFVRDTTADKLFARAVPCIFIGFVPDAPGWQFYHPTSRHVFPSQDVTFDESVLFYRLFPYHTAPLPPPPLFLAPGAPQVDPLPALGPAPSGVSQVDPPPLTAPVEFTGDSGPAEGGPARGTASRGAEPGGAEPGGAEPGGAEPGGAEPGGAETGGGEPGREESRGAEPGGTESGGAAPGGAEASGEQSPWDGPGAEGFGAAGGAGTAGGAGAAGAGGAAQPRLFFAPPSPSSPPLSDSVPRQVLSLPWSTGLPLEPGSPLPAPSPYTEQTGGLTERREPASRTVSPFRSGHPGCRVPRSRQPAVTGTHLVVRRPSSPPQRVPLPSPPASSLPTVPERLAFPLYESHSSSSSVATRSEITFWSSGSF